MKLSLFPLAILLAFVLQCISCNPASDPASAETADDDASPLLDTADREAALQAIEAHGQFMRCVFEDVAPNIEHAWHIPLDQIRKLDPSITAIRVYLAQTNLNDVPVSNLYFVPVIDNLDQTDVIYNLINPCPNVCDATSALFQRYHAGLNTSCLTGDLD
ncbi:MAG: hypothetical protein AAGB22_13420 [Bacteroidota bacterium]